MAKGACREEEHWAVRERNGETERGLSHGHLHGNCEINVYGFKLLNLLLFVIQQ